MEVTSALFTETLGIVQRRLVDANATGSTSTTNDSVVLRNTFKVYGSAFLVLFSVFCWARVRYPRVYHVRSWIEDLQSKLADTQYGFLEWTYKLWWVSDDDFREACGMDALCFIRILRFGLKIALLGMFNSLWLCPIYATSPSHPNTASVTDWVAIMTIANVPPGSPRLFATVISAYMFFGYIMYLMLQEFKWFTDQRHKYLARTSAQNYTVYVSHIPPEIRSSAMLLDYFRRAFSHDAVLEAHIALKIPNLEKKVAARESLVGKLEHAINLEEVKGKTPTHRSINLKGRKVNSINVWTTQLRKENQEIRDAIKTIEAMHDPMSFQEDLEADGGFVMSPGYSVRSTRSSYSDVDTSAVRRRTSSKAIVSMQKDEVSSFRKSDSGKVLSFLKNTAKTTSGLASSTFKNLVGRDDGEPRQSGFITFTKLSSTQACLQMIHHPIPFTMTVAEAPDPDDIFWANVGKSHESLQLGKLAGLCCTIILCLFWTVPVSFIASLTAIDSLTAKLPFLAKWVEEAPWLAPALAQLAPVMIILLNSMLPMILGEFCKLEGPISSSILEASLFVKLAAFMIIQTFFVSAVSGALLSELSNILDNPSSIVELLAKSLPGQSTYFVQILLVKTFLGLGLELLKVTPLVVAGIRSIVGPGLTEKERNSIWMGLRPLAAPAEFAYSDITSSAILYYMVLFVYSSTAPTTNWFMFFCFAILSSGYRYQFIYNYPTTPDSGGKIWTGFISIALPCMFIAQITLVGLLTLNQALLAVPFTIPLLIIQVFFGIYIKQRHFYVTNFLPSRECLNIDLRNNSECRMDFSFVNRKYLQPAMQSKEDLQPENLSVEREIAQQDVTFMTPPSSEAEIKDYDYEQDSALVMEHEHTTLLSEVPSK